MYTVEPLYNGSLKSNLKSQWQQTRIEHNDFPQSKIANLWKQPNS